MIMKKILALLLSMMLVLALFSACGTDNTTDPDDDSNQTADGEDTNTPDDDNGEDANTPDDDNGGEDADTPDSPDGENGSDTSDSGETGDHDGNTDGSGDTAVLDGALSEIIDQIYENKSLDLNLATRDLDIGNADELKYNTGLDNGDLISAASVSETMIGSQAYSMVLVRVKDAQDAQSVAESMKNGIDTRKWICVEADDLRVVAYDDLVLLVMIDSEFSDLATADELVEAFGTVCGGAFSADLQ